MSNNPRNSGLIFVLALLLQLCGTWSIPLIDRDEPRFAEASREMRQRRDFIVPYFNDKYRFDKPALIYWCQVAAYSVFGENEFAARLPSNLAAAATAVLIYWLGRRMAGEQMGLIGAAAFAVCPLTIYIGKAATADMVMVFFVTLATWAGWELIAAGTETAPGKRRMWWWTFYIALGLGFLTKGPVAWLPLGTAMITCGLLRDRAAFQRLGLGWGVLVMLAVAGSWGIPAQLATDWQYMQVGIGKHVLQRGVEPMEGHGGQGTLAYLLMLPFHFLGAFVFFLPWSFWLPAMVRWFRNEGRQTPAYVYLGMGVLLTFVLFSFYATKLPHYTLPGYPMLALLFGAFCSARGIGWERIRRRALVFGGGAALLCLVVPPFIAQYFPSKQLFLATKQWLKPEMEWASVDYTEGSLIWYYRTIVRPFHRSIGEKKVPDFMKEKGPRFVILPTEKANAVAMDPSWKLVRMKGFNLPKGKKTDLTLILKES